MSIWNKLDEYEGSVYFYGFPMKPSIKDGFITFYFPEGYAPNRSQTKSVARDLIKLVGEKSEQNEVTDKIVKIKISEVKLACVIYDAFITGEK